MIFVDLETTDLINGMTDDPNQQPGIIQIGLIEVTDGGFETEHKFDVNPEVSVWAEGAIKGHGIKPEDVAECPTLSALLPKLADIFRRHHTWVGYNNEFDRKVLFYQVLRYGWGWKFPWPSFDIDVMKVGRDIANIAGKSDVKYPKLVELHTTLFGEGFSGAHDALEDIRATYRCFNDLSKKGYI